MKVKNLSALAGLGGALILSGTADAAYVGLSCSLRHNAVMSGGLARDVYNIYADFTVSTDFFVGANGNLASPMVIQNINGTDTGAGSGFYNPGSPASASNLAPYDASEGEEEFGSYLTVGLKFGSEAPDNSDGDPTDQTALAPGTPNFATGMTYSTNNGGWFVTGAQAQGQASYIVNGEDTALRVLIMQVAVNDGDSVKGTVNVLVNLGTPVSELFLGQTFNCVPAPGALALLGVAGLVGSRRRRA